MIRFLFLGTRGAMSVALLDGLLAAGRVPVGVVVPGNGARSVEPVLAPAAPSGGLTVLPAAAQQSVLERAWQAGVPAWAVSRWDPASLQWLAEQRAMLGIVACWPERLPFTVLDGFAYGLWNLHPSYLPDYRGPAPFFWQRRDGLTESAITLHRMSATLDAGPIIGQRELPLPDGALDQELDRLAGRAALPLVLEALDARDAGALQPAPQPGGGSYQGWPGEEDFRVPTTWTARHAWNFMRVAQVWGVPFRVQTLAGERDLPAPAGWSPATRPKEVPERDGLLSIPFAEGEVWWRIGVTSCGVS